jgi:hypothetical protein
MTDYMSISSTQVGLGLGALGLIGLFLCIMYVRRTCRFWIAEGAKIAKTGGYVTPYVSRLSRVALYLVAHTAGRIVLGGIKVKGMEKLRNRKARLIICPNHQFEHDAIASSFLIGMRRWRFLSAIDQVQGIRSSWFAWIGIVSVEHTSMRGRVKVLGCIVDALKREPGTGFIIFPQGKLVETDELIEADWNTGSAIISTRAAAATGDRFSLLPAHIRYVTDPAKAKLWQRILAALGVSRKFCGRTVYGCEIMLGEEIPTPADGDKNDLTSLLFAQTVALKGAH